MSTFKYLYGFILKNLDTKLFGSVLTGKNGTGIKSGVDLDGWEIKSSSNTNGYEYQYHSITGLQKLKDDCISNHLFCNYYKIKT